MSRKRWNLPKPILPDRFVFEADQTGERKCIKTQEKSQVLLGEDRYRGH
jgi:hypothetical protein